MFCGHFTVYGLNVQRQKLHNSMNRVKERLGIPKNPSPTNRIVPRIEYKADGPRSTLHMDGWHKGKRYRIFLHGGIDGFSRALVFLECATNNKAQTVLMAFNRGISLWGLPDLIR